MELASLKDGRIGDAATSSLGPLFMRGLPKAKRAGHVEKTLAKLAKRFDGSPETLFLVGGAWRAFAQLDMARCGYSMPVLHDYRLTPEAIEATNKLIAKSSYEEIKTQAETISTARLPYLADTGELLSQIVAQFAPETTAVSAYGLREGLLFEQMPEEIRELDPLVEAARYLEETSARFPGFSGRIYHWLIPLFPEADRLEQRLIRAACHLHDVAWRTHPDYRAAVCFETVTRGNLGGVSHRDRVRLGIALSWRYRRRYGMASMERMQDLIDDQDRVWAETLGRALRLGALLSGGTVSLLRRSNISLEGESGLVLRLEAGAKVQSGGSVERRFGSLASAMGREGRIEQG